LVRLEFGVICDVILSKAAFMSSPTQPAAVSATEELAARIYVELVGRAFLRVDNAAVIKPDPAELAKLSIQLAETFLKAENAARTAAGPKNVGYDVRLTDLAGWDK
jgi:hypothetical protein